MSIAVSVIVRPSRLMLAMVCAMCALAAASGVAAALECVRDRAPAVWVPVVVFSLFLAVFGFYHGIRCRKPIHIDISGSGQIRLRQVSAAASCAEKSWPHLQENMDAVRLLNDSTIWPHLLLLRLQSDSGKITVLPILPDSVSRDSFRALSVACRWVATQGSGKDRENSQNRVGLD